MDNFSGTGGAELLVGDHTTTAMEESEQIRGSWVTYSASYLAQPEDQGAQISILLTSHGAEGDFGNVRLNAYEPVPEPTSLALLGLAACFLASVRRRASV